MIQVLSILALALFASPATAWWEVNAPLHYAAPQSVGLLPQPLLDLKTNASAYTVPRNCSCPLLAPAHLQMALPPITRSTLSTQE
jgi:hypothetical protein